jgi:hypothetical protein
LLRRAALRGAGAFCEEFAALTADALGLPLPAALAGGLFRIGYDSGQRLAGLIASAVERERLIEAHDIDWYRNPRAAEQLRAEAKLSPEAQATPALLDDGARALLSQLTAAL